MERCIICGEEAKRSLSDKPMRISKFLSDPIFRYAIRGIELSLIHISEPTRLRRLAGWGVWV